MRPLRLVLFSAVALSVLPARAIDIDSLQTAMKSRPVELSENMVTLQAGISTGDDASLAYELGYTWYPLRYAGLSLGLELDDNKGEKGLFSSDEYDRFTYDHTRVVRLNLHPALAFRLPLVQWRQKRRMLTVQCNPGLVVSVPKNDSKRITSPIFSEEAYDSNGKYIYKQMHLKNRDGKWLAWRVRSALTLCGDEWAISLGWSISNYNILSCRNNMYYKGKRVSGYDRLEKTNTLFVAASYCF